MDLPVDKDKVRKNIVKMCWKWEQGPMPTNVLYILCSFVSDAFYLNVKVLVEKMGLPEGYDSSSATVNGDVLRKF